MKKYLLIFTSILFLWGCIAEDRTECANPRGVFVSLTVRPERMSSVTRTTDETAIRDLNLYLYDDNGNVVLHRYQTSATLRFECLPGDYRMCIAANLGRDLGENPTWEDFTVTHADKYDVLPMAYEGDITIIPSADGVLTLPTVEVQRCVTKISYNISVKPADIELRSVQLLSVPRSTSVFDAAAPSDNPDDYTDCLEVGLSGQLAAGDCYLLPNMQGTVSAITDQRQKNPDNAPANASYLLIRAVRGAKVLAYYIYLGGNNTSDFNVRTNVHYRFNISILGDGEIQEGQVWEASMFAGHRKLDNLVVIVDNNNMQIDGTLDEVCSPDPIDKKFEAFNFHVIHVADGNDFAQLAEAFKEARETKGMPTAIIAHTLKGKGVSYMEGQVGWHGKAPNDEEYAIAMEELGKAGEALCQK